MRIKVLIKLCIIHFGLIQISIAQSPNCEWVKNYGWIGGVGGFSKITSDEKSNIYMLNDFACSSISFDGIILYNQSWNQNSTVGLVKYDSLGNVLWAKTADSGYFNYITPKSIATDSKGNIYIAGLFMGDSIKFENVTLKTPFTTGLYDNMFLVKFSPLGNVLWGKCASANTTIGSCQINGITIDSNDNPIVIGNFTSSNIILDNDTIFNTNKDLPTTGDFFLIKYDNNGNTLWAKGFGSLSFDEGNSITSNINDIYITGYFSGEEIAFGDTILANQNSTGRVSNFFLTKLDMTGNVIWATSSSTERNSAGVSVSQKKDGIVYVSGEFNELIILGKDTLLNNSGSKGLFFAAFDTTGSPIWAKSTEFDYDAKINSIHADQNGNLYLIGDYRSEKIKFDTIILYNNHGGSDIFVAKYNYSGNNIWAKSFGGNDNDFGRDITVLKDNLYITGTQWSPSINIGDKRIDAHTAPYGHDDIFIAKFSGTCIGNTIVYQTENQFKLEGESVTFNVSADGSPFIYYQWYRNGYQVDGESNSSYSVPNLTSSYNGSLINCIVSNCDYSCSNISIIDTLEVCTKASAYVFLTNEGFALGDSVVLMVITTGTSPFYYQWYKNDSFILGADSSIYTSPNLSETDNGNTYYCKINNCKGLGNVQSNIITINFPLGIYEAKNIDNQIKIHPNPCHGELTIEMNEINQKYLVTITNIKGCKMLKHIFDNNKIKIDISNLNQGIYFLNIKNDKEDIVKMIIKE